MGVTAWASHGGEMPFSWEESGASKDLQGNTTNTHTGDKEQLPGFADTWARVSHGATGQLTTAYSMVKIRRLTGEKRWTPSYSRRSTSCSTGRGRAERGKMRETGGRSPYKYDIPNRYYHQVFLFIS